MFKLTRKVEYALIALRYLSIKGEDTVTSTKEIAEHHDIPVTLLAKILQNLAKHHVIEPVQGPRGGYTTSSESEKISLTQFMEIIEGPFGLVDCSSDANCQQLSHCNILEPIHKINDIVRGVFDNVTLDQITNPTVGTKSL